MPMTLSKRDNKSIFWEIAVQSTNNILGLILGCPIGPAYYGKGTNSRTHHTSN
jgi:hypothetical protein